MTRLEAAAVLINAADEFGPLHIFVSDGNCEDEHLRFCLDRPDITEGEAEFVNKMLVDFTVDERLEAWELAQRL